MESRTTLGDQIVDHAFHALKVEEEWCVAISGGFEWLPWRIAQRVQTNEGIEDAGYTVYTVTARMNVLSQVKVSADAFEILGNLNSDASMGAWILDRNSGDVFHQTSVEVHDEIVDGAKLFMEAACVLQAIEVEAECEKLRDRIGGELVFSAHPRSGAREEPAPMLLIEEVFTESAFEDDLPLTTEFESIKRMNPSPSLLTNTGEGELTAEFPFDVMNARDDAVPLTALFKATTREGHVNLGSGCTITLDLPIIDRNSETAGLFNVLEHAGWNRCNRLGAWHIGERGLRHTTFIPALACMPMVVTNLFMNEALRCHWIADIWLKLKAMEKLPR